MLLTLNFCKAAALNLSLLQEPPAVLSLPLGGDGKCSISLDPLLQNSWLCCTLFLSFPAFFAENTVPGAIIARQQVHTKLLFFGHLSLN